MKKAKQNEKRKGEYLSQIIFCSPPEMHETNNNIIITN
ncbi:hypothetical protein EC2016001_5274 [Escherichia coli 201600.1]|nr:hypothetical protein EC2016001_5274 [Escherichia coli 201600.1]